MTLSKQACAHAELDRINFGPDDTRVMLELLRRFFGRWDSGGAVSVAAPILARLIAGKPLSPLTGADDEWVDVRQYGPEPPWQNRRCASVFKRVDGSAFDVDAPGTPVTFPYWPAHAVIPDPVIVFDVEGL